jgi:hypothetical protein
MLRDDLEQTRLEWLAESADDIEHESRQASDFLVDTNHDGKFIDFHSLRHTCGAWMAAAGVNPKTVQTVMRHSSITLTMDTYGHLFPGDEASAVNRMEGVFNQDGAQRQEQRAGCDHLQQDAKACDKRSARSTQEKSRKSMVSSDMCHSMRQRATPCEKKESAPARTRTLDPLIKSQLLCQLR